MKLTLFSREDCPLCEDAEEQLLRLGIPFEYVDIDSSEKLLKMYHTQVPVLMKENNEVINWPFDESKLSGFINE